MFELLLLAQPPGSPSSSATARKLPTIIGRVGSRVPTSHTPELVPTSEGSWFQPGDVRRGAELPRAAEVAGASLGGAALEAAEEPP